MRTFGSTDLHKALHQKKPTIDSAVKSTDFIGCQGFSVFVHWCEIIKKKNKKKNCDAPMHCHGTRQGNLSFTYMNHFFLFFFLSLEVSHFPTLVLAPSMLS